MVLIILVVIFVIVLDVTQVQATMSVDELSMSSGSAIAGATKRSGLRLW